MEGETMTNDDDDEEMARRNQLVSMDNLIFIICILPRSLYRVQSDVGRCLMDTDPDRTDPSRNRRFDDWMRACNILGRGLETLYTDILLVEQLLRFTCGLSTSIVVWQFNLFPTNSFGGVFCYTLTPPLPKRWI